MTGRVSLWRTNVMSSIRVLAAQLRSGVPATAGAVSVAVCVAIALLAELRFLPGLADPLNFNLTTLAYLGPIACGAAALHARSLVNRGVCLIASSTPAGWQGAITLGWLAILCWQLAALLLGLALTLLQSDLSGPKTAPMLLLPMLASSALIPLTLLGTVVGRKFPFRGTAPILAVVVFVLIYALSFMTNRAAVLSVIYPAVYYQIFLEPNVALLIGQVVAIGGLSLLMMAQLSRHTFPIAVVALVGLALGGVRLATVDPKPVQVRDPPKVVACANKHGIELCVWPEQRASLDPGLYALSRVGDAANGFIPIHRRYSQPGLGKTSSSTYLVPESDAESEEFLFLAVRAAAPALACSSPKAEDSWFAIVSWLEARASGMTDAPPEIMAVTRLPESQQRSWLQERIQSITAC